ncbi:TadE-like protein [Sphingomonas jeddahensis]|uniref:TadE-like protein n=1 Tax=Sphingomonas jeddahensis TaxID=1915074 RepID=A0A1V2ETL2_9SPHN|nr:TadE-like protein [Sphingomonas jeddahensis]
MRCVQRLLGDRRGVTVVEFAIVVPVMCMMMMGLGDLLYQTYANELLSGSIQKAARDSAIQGGADQADVLDGQVIDMLAQIMQRPTASCSPTPLPGTYCSRRRSYAVFSAAGPEPFNDDNGNNLRETGECYQDLNNNGTWDAQAANGVAGQGGANEVTLYTISVTYPRIFPVPALFGWSSSQTISAQTLLKNQPYASRIDPTVTWKCN